MDERYDLDNQDDKNRFLIKYKKFIRDYRFDSQTTDDDLVYEILDALRYEGFETYKNNNIVTIY